MSLSERDIDRIIEMAWEDRTPFEAISYQFSMREQEVIKLMRREMKPSSFKMWPVLERVGATKHQKLRTFVEGRFKCSRQKQITHNSISKR
tara:strand:- start:2222 stop:2494 length:273 start_codon:yes stop_codon:yes gene_type:complete